MQEVQDTNKILGAICQGFISRILFFYSTFQMVVTKKNNLTCHLKESKHRLKWYFIKNLHINKLTLCVVVTD